MKIATRLAKAVAAAQKTPEERDLALKGPGKVVLKIEAANMRTMLFKMIGDSIYVQSAFGPKALQMMIERQMAGDGDGSAKKKKREPKDFKRCYEEALHQSKDGWYGIPANGLRSAILKACDAGGVKVTKAKLALVVLGDGMDRDEMTPLVRITKGNPKMFIAPAPNYDGSMDLRARPMWASGWEAMVRVKFDADMIAANSVFNVLSRAGEQVGIGEGRQASKNSGGMGWGYFHVEPVGRMV